ncbi:polyamine ABC transporter substrate-binding protein, partial [Agrobacterium tumefaciens]|nr:polyamine ABC transporter substrate-binding protein [Agrobacterium tumefaciens]
MTNKTGISKFSALIAISLSTAALPYAVEAATLRVGAAAENVATLDPTRATATVDVGVVSWMFNGLVRFPPGSADPTKIEPDLAE